MTRSPLLSLLLLSPAPPGDRFDQLARNGEVQQDAPIKAALDLTVNAPPERQLRSGSPPPRTEHATDLRLQSSSTLIVIVRRPHLAAPIFFALTAALPAQTSTGTPPASKPAKPAPKPVVPYVNHNLVFLDPAHGGADAGAHLPGQLLEKDITLALAGRIRSLLAANGIGVLVSREADAPATSETDDSSAPIATPDQRAGAANHVHPVACLLIHATGSGAGVHVITSPLSPPEPPPADSIPTPFHATPWESAQADSVAQSLRLSNEIATAVTRANLPVHLSRGSVRPIDSLTCPAVAIEVAPLASGATPVSDAAYQQRVAQAVATALLFWRGHADPPLPPRSDLPGAQP